MSSASGKLKNRLKRAWNFASNNKLITGGVGALVAIGVGVAVAKLTTTNGTTSSTTTSAASPTPPKRASPPVQIVVSPNEDQITNNTGAIGGDYWFADKASRIPRPPGGRDSCVGRYDWAVAHHGVPATAANVRVTLTDSGSQPVNVTDFSIDVLKRTKARAGTIVTCAGRGSGGPASVFTLSGNLDLLPVPVTATRAGSSDSAPTIAFSLAPHRARIFDITVQDFGHFCEWEGAFHLVVDGKAETLKVTDDHKPFETNGLATSSMARYQRHHWVITRRAPRRAP